MSYGTAGTVSASVGEPMSGGDPQPFNAANLWSESDDDGDGDGDDGDGDDGARGCAVVVDTVPAVPFDTTLLLSDSDGDGDGGACGGGADDADTGLAVPFDTTLLLSDSDGGSDRDGDDSNSAPEDHRFDCVNTGAELPPGVAAGHRAAALFDAGCGWELGLEPGRGWGIRYLRDVSEFMDERETPSCEYALSRAPLVRVRRAEYEGRSDLLLPDVWGDGDTYAYLPEKRGLASYANDATVALLEDGTPARVTNGRWNAKHFHVEAQEGRFLLHLRPGYKAGEWVSVEYGMPYWESLCANAIDAKAVRAEHEEDPTYRAGGPCEWV